MVAHPGAVRQPPEFVAGLDAPDLADGLHLDGAALAERSGSGAREGTMYDRLAEFLAARQAKYETITHASAVTAQEQAAAVHASGHTFAKVLIVKERDGFVMAIVPAATELDLDRLKGLVGHGEIRLATVEEIGSVIPDCAPGAIPPFGALYGLRSFVDRSLLLVPQVTMPAGSFASALRMRSTEFRRLVDAHEGEFAVAESLVAAGGVARPRRPGRRPASTERRRR
jgi:Ala-tRNA(Pro) deacylase